MTLIQASLQAIPVVAVKIQAIQVLPVLLRAVPVVAVIIQAIPVIPLVLQALPVIVKDISNRHSFFSASNATIDFYRRASFDRLLVAPVIDNQRPALKSQTKAAKQSFDGVNRIECRMDRTMGQSEGLSTSDQEGLSTSDQE